MVRKRSDLSLTAIESYGLPLALSMQVDGHNRICCHVLSHPLCHIWAASLHSEYTSYCPDHRVSDGKSGTPVLSVVD